MGFAPAELRACLRNDIATSSTTCKQKHNFAPTITYTVQTFQPLSLIMFMFRLLLLDVRPPR
jgi:hypothetical protein